MTVAPDPSETHYVQIRRVLWAALLVNLLVVISKIAVAIMTHSVAALAEVIYGILNGSGSAISLLGLYYANQPPDERHPYGHHRWESLAALAVGVMTAVGLVELLRAMWDGLSGGGSPPVIGSTSVVWLLLTVILNLTLAFYAAKRGRELGSRMLEVDAARSTRDAAGLGVVLLAFALVHVGWTWVDTIAAGYVAYLIARAALGIVRENAEVLIDTAQLDPEEVRNIARGVPGVLDAYAVRSRGTPGRVSLDLSVQVDPDLTVAAAHIVTHRVQDTLEARLPMLVDVVVHTEPGEEADAPA